MWVSSWQGSTPVCLRGLWLWPRLNSSGGSQPQCGPVLPCCLVLASWLRFSTCTGRKVSRLTPSALSSVSMSCLSYPSYVYSALWPPFHIPLSSSLLFPHIFISTMFTDISSLCYSLRIRELVPQSYKITSKISHVMCNNCWKYPSSPQ